jgi:hypothetical protein
MQCPDFDAAVIGQPVEIVTRAGWFGWEWIESMKFGGSAR